MAPRTRSRSNPGLQPRGRALTGALGAHFRPLPSIPHQDHPHPCFANGAVLPPIHPFPVSHSWCPQQSAKTYASLPLVRAATLGHLIVPAALRPPYAVSECCHQNAAEMKFCGECGTRVAVLCRQCDAATRPLRSSAVSVALGSSLAHHLVISRHPMRTRRNTLPTGSSPSRRLSKASRKQF